MRMKRLLYTLGLIILSLCCVLPADAQRKNNKYRSLSVGVRGGVTMSKVTFRPSVREKYQIGMNVGASIRYIEEKYFGIIGEVNFAQFGWKEDFSKQPNPDCAYSRTMNYITVPFLSHIFFGNEPIRGFLNLGPQIGFCLSTSDKSNFDIYDLPYLTQSWETQQYYEPLNSRFDYGITGGLGFELKLKKHSFIVEARYYFGLNDFFENSKGNAAYFSASAHQQISAGISYLFHIK